MDSLDATIARAVAGDAGAFRDLHDAYDGFVSTQIRCVLSTAVDHAVNDVAQEVWEVVHRDLPNYKSDMASFTRWIAVIAIRRALNHQRRERARQEAVRRYQALAVSSPDTLGSNPARALEESELIAAVRECAALLQGRQREIFAAVRLAAATVAIVAEQLGITAGRVRGTLCEANQKVLDCLRGKGLV